MHRVKWSEKDLAILSANPQLSVTELHRLLPHFSLYSLRKKRAELTVSHVPLSGCGSGWSLTDAAICDRWRSAFSLMYARGAKCRAC